MFRLIPHQIAVILIRAIKCRRLKTRNKLYMPQFLPKAELDQILKVKQELGFLSIRLSIDTLFV